MFNLLLEDLEGDARNDTFEFPSRITIKLIDFILFLDECLILNVEVLL